MTLREGEIIVRVIKRHFTPYILRMLGVAVIAIPLYIVFFILAAKFDSDIMYYLIAILSIFVGVIVMLVSLDYLFDKLIITNKRIMWIDWKSPFKKEEHETELLDIQDIETREKGVLSKLKIFDYGFFEVETSAAKVCISFNDCPDPNGLKNFVIQQMANRRGQMLAVKPPQQELTKEKGNDEWSVN